MNNEAKLQKAPQRMNAAPKKKKIASLDKRKARVGWLFVLPFVIGFVIIYLPIVYDSILYSFTKISIVAGGGYRLTWVGLENYQEALFVDPTYVQTLTAGIKQLIFDIPAIVIFSLFMAISSSKGSHAIYMIRNFPPFFSIFASLGASML